MTRARTVSVLLVSLSVAACGGCQVNRQRNQAAQAAGGRQWARPVELAGVPNLYRVDEGLYRSAQPDRRGMAALAAMGIKTVICLRANDDNSEDPAGAGLKRMHLGIPVWAAPDDETVVQFLRIVRDPARRPVLVHCRAGADRTGMMCAVYRVAVQGWSKDEAVAEWTEGGFGFHEIFDHLVEGFRELDIDRLARAAARAETMATTAVRTGGAAP